MVEELKFSKRKNQLWDELILYICIIYYDKLTLFVLYHVLMFFCDH